jgi:hypothetical protein
MQHLIGRRGPARPSAVPRWVAWLVPLLVLAGLLAAPAAAQAAAFDPTLTRAPYLTDLVGTHVNVNWGTDQSASTGSLQWGAVTGGTCQLTNTLAVTPASVAVGTVTEYRWKASLDLPGSGTYCYRPWLAGTDLLATNPSPQFQTQVPAGDSTPFSFDVFGDWGQVDATGANADQAALMSQIAASGARFAVTVGDNGYPAGSQLNYGDLLQTGQDTSAIFGPSFWTVAGSTVPLFTAAGNHGLSGPAHTDITTWTQDTAVASSGGRYQNDVYCCVNGSTSANYGSEWYAFDAGPARFYVLDAAWGDTNVGTASVYANDAAAHFAPGDPEYAWLLNDLQTHPSTLKFAFFHYPLYADNPNQSSDTSLQGLNSLEGLLGLYGVDIVFNGHAHMYERNLPSATGMPISYVTGGGGATLEPIGPCHTYDAYGIGWSPTSSHGSACGAATAPPAAANVYHFLNVGVNGNTVTVTPTDETGHTFDVQTYTFSNVPDTVIDSGPPSLTNASSATFSFHSTRILGASYTCSLDGAPATSCTSPISYSGLGTGPHSFSVAATTADGTDPTPASTAWTVDTSPPSTPANLVANVQSATAVSLSWTAATDNYGVTGYDIQRNGVTIGSASLGSTGAPLTNYLDATAAPSTSYQYAVVARDAAGNSSAASAPVSVTTPVSTGLPTLVQNAGSSTTTVTLAGPSAPGDLLVLTAGVFTGASKQITAISDGSNAWTKAGAYTVAGQNSDGELWYAANAASVRTITVTTAAPVALQVQEFTNVIGPAVADGVTGAAAYSNSASSGLVTPTATNDLVVGYVAGHANAQSITVTSPGYTLLPQQTTTSPNPVSVLTGYQVQPGLAAQSITASFGTMYWSAGVALFKAAPPPDFSLSATPSTVTVPVGQSGSSVISSTVTSGAPEPVTLTAAGLPAGATASFTTTSIASGQSATLTVSTSANTPVGSYPITVTGTGTTATHTVTVTLVVPPLVQAAGATEASAATTLTATLPAASLTGDLLVLSASVYTGSTNHITSVTDSAGNVWQRANASSVAGHNSDGELWYAANTAPASSVVAHLATAGTMAIEVLEFTGIATSNPLDTSVGTSNTGTAASSGLLTPAASGELLVGFVAGHANSQAMTVTSSGFTLQPQQNSTGTIATVATGYQLLTGTGATSFDAGFGTAMYWAAGIAAFKPH